MKNVIIIVLDAFGFQNINKTIGGYPVTPFLNQLIQESTSYSNMYSNAPYTEASLVSLLSGENTLDNGGYLFGNGTVKSSVFEKFKLMNYKTLSQFSPYVYSKAYLTGVDSFFYTRLYSISPLLNYRFSYYNEKYEKNTLTEEDIRICTRLLSEAFDTWKKQIHDLQQNSNNCDLISNWVNTKDLPEITTKLNNEISLFLNDSRDYVKKLIQLCDNHYLKSISEDYNSRLKKNFPDINEYSWISKYQPRYNNSIKRIPNPRYWWNIYRTEGIGQLSAILHNYRQYYNNNDITQYFTHSFYKDKVEASIYRQLNLIKRRIIHENIIGNKVFAYVQPQDFHLPSCFHSFDIVDPIELGKEFACAENLLNHLDNKYRGNIISDLSAHYCDFVLSEFFNSLKNESSADFELIITADHGFPLFMDPPRPYTYNQTYKAAFHVPLIHYCSDKKVKTLNTSYCSLKDLGSIISGQASSEESSRTYVLCEYAGPGCPDISKKKIWYTYISDEYRISFQELIEKDISIDSITDIFHLKNDSKEQYNKVKTGYRKNNAPIIAIVQKRHTELRRKFQKGFESSMLQSLEKFDEEFCK